MKHRICLAWFGDLDAPDRVRAKTKKTAARPTSTPDSLATARPKVKGAAELRRMFGRA